jgi:poly-gamma-glutamate synthesis protein (capsule biosynthesis protein)
MRSPRGAAWIFLVAGVVLSGAAIRARAVSGASLSPPARLIFAGDILLSRGVARRLGWAPRALARALQPTLERADWTEGNLEGAVGEESDCAPAAPGSPCFATPARLIPLLAGAGFKAIGVENNHGADLGAKGILETRAALEASGIAPLSFDESPRFVAFEGFTLGVVALSLVPGRDGRSVAVPSPDLRRKLRLARNLSNLVVVTIHWGSELLDWPDAKQRRAAAWLIENGADIIIGAHPHVVQNPECLAGRPVFYSLGNLVFDQAYPDAREGLLADCGVSGGEVRCAGISTRTPADSVFPEVGGPAAEAGKVLSGCAFPLSPGLTVNGLTLKPRAGKRSGSGLVLEASREGKTLWRTHPIGLVSAEAMKIPDAGGSGCLFTLEEHYSPLDGVKALRPYVYAVRDDGLAPRWRGTALAWPLVDAALLPGEEGILCALHRGDSFLAPGTGAAREGRVAAYRWKGFGFAGVDDPGIIDRCRNCFR